VVSSQVVRCVVTTFVAEGIGPSLFHSTGVELVL